MKDNKKDINAVIEESTALPTSGKDGKGAKVDANALDESAPVVKLDGTLNDVANSIIDAVIKLALNDARKKLKRMCETRTFVAACIEEAKYPKSIHVVTDMLGRAFKVAGNFDYIYSEISEESKQLATPVDSQIKVNGHTYYRAVENAGTKEVPKYQPKEVKDLCDLKKSFIAFCNISKAMIVEERKLEKRNAQTFDEWKAKTFSAEQLSLLSDDVLKALYEKR